MNSPDDTTFRVLDWIISAIGGLLLLLWGMLTGRIKKAEDSTERITSAHNDLQIHLAGNYVPKTELDKLADALFRKLDKIEDKIDMKADK